jgi:phosphatidylglycerophosphatase A
MNESPENPGKAPVPWFARFIATGFYSGYSPVASGTAGSAVGVLIYAIPAFQSQVVLCAASAAGLLIGAYVSGVMERSFGEDPSIVVIDEIVGMWISLLFLPPSIATVLAAFLFFRAFDIIKPPPARQLERLKGGWGVMLDDAAAGVYANVAVQLLWLLFPQMMG